MIYISFYRIKNMDEDTQKVIDELIGQDDELDFYDDGKGDDVGFVLSDNDADIGADDTETPKVGVKTSKYTLQDASEEKSLHIYAASELLKSVGDGNPPYFDLRKTISFAEVIHELQVYRYKRLRE
jgi:hypothetical protein